MHVCVHHLPSSDLMVAVPQPILRSLCVPKHLVMNFERCAPLDFRFQLLLYKKFYFELYVTGCFVCVYGF